LFFAAFLQLVLLSIPTKAQVGKYDVYEHTISYFFNERDRNPWVDVIVDVDLISPNGCHVDIGGFFYESNTWKWRFAPNEVGTWCYSWKLMDGETLITGDGTLQVEDSNNKGFVRQNPNNPFRWVFDNGEPFYPLGTQDCWGPDRNNNHIDADNWRIGELWGLSMDQVLSEYHNAGINLWRLNNENCCPKLWTTFSPNGNVYNIRAAKEFDAFATAIRANDLRIDFVLFGSGWETGVPFGNSAIDIAKMESLRHYVSYVVNRYGAYVDFWEIANEVPASECSDQVLAIIANHIRSVDPYGPRAIGMSWERPEVPEISMNNPHWYRSPTPDMFDIQYVNFLNSEKSSCGKPVIWTEFGNKGVCHTPESPFRWRVATWSIFFNEGAVIFWQTSNPEYTSGAANAYFNAEVRRYFSYLDAYNRDFDKNAVPVIVPVSNKSVRTYGLLGPKHFGLYIYDYSRPYNGRSGVIVNLSGQVSNMASGVGVWIDPVMGMVRSTVTITPETTQLVVPYFVSDIALKVPLSAATEQVLLENPSFELPGIAKVKGWDGACADPAWTGLVYDIPGWSSDSPAFNSGVEIGNVPTEGLGNGFLTAGDPAVWQLTGHTIASDEVFELKVDARKDSRSAVIFKLALYYDNFGIRVPLASKQVIINDTMQEYSLVFTSNEIPTSADYKIGIQFLNVTGVGRVLLDRVRLGLIASELYEDFETGDFSKFKWDFLGDSEWDIISQEKKSGSFGAKAGLINDYETSSLSITIWCSDGNIKFHRKVSSESHYDFLRFYIDGTEKGHWSGEQDWDEVSFPVTQGIRTFEWIYSKDNSISGGEDTAWIDDIVFPFYVNW